MTQSYSTEWDGFTLEADRFRGGAVGMTGALSDNWGARALVSSTSHNDADIDASGFEAMVLWGSNLRRQGFKAFIGAGFFSETWDFGSAELNASGWALGVGAGYNWDRVTMDLMMSLRDGSDYEREYKAVLGGNDWTVTPTTVGLNVGFRF